MRRSTTIGLFFVAIGCLLAGLLTSRKGARPVAPAPLALSPSVARDRTQTTDQSQSVGIPEPQATASAPRKASEGTARPVSLKVEWPTPQELPDYAYLFANRTCQLRRVGLRRFEGQLDSQKGSRGRLFVPGFSSIQTEWTGGKTRLDLGAFRLHRGKAIHVQVVDEENQGIPTASVILNPSLPNSFCGPEGITDIRFDTDLNGCVTIGGLWGNRVLLHIQKVGFDTRAAKVRLADAKEVSVQLLRTARIHGRVLDPEGRPLVGATIGVPAEVRPLKGITDSTGAFTITDVVAGQPFEGLIWATAETASTRFPVPALQPGELRDLGEFTASAGAEFFGVAVGDDGRPLSGETIVVTARPEQNEDDPLVRMAAYDAGKRRTATLDARGRFGFSNLTPGRYEVTVSSDGFSDQETVVHLPTTLPCIVRPDPRFRRYGGVVRTEDGRPVPDADVYFSFEHGVERSFESERTNSEGRFGFRDLPNASAFPTVSVSYGAMQQHHRAETLGGLPSEFVFRPAAPVEIRVGDTTTNALRCRLVLYDAKDDPVGAYEPSSPNLFRIETLSPGSYTALIRSTGHRSVRLRVEAGPRTPFSATVFLEELEGFTHRLRVADADGQPILFAYLTYGDRRLTTDSRGHADLVFYQGSGDSLKVTALGYYSTTYRENALRATLERGAPIVLKKLANITANVSAEKLLGAKYLIVLEPIVVPELDKADHHYGRYVSESGEYEFEHRPAGRYAVVVRRKSANHDDWILARAELIHSDEQPGSVVVTLPPHFSITGSVRRNGTPLDGATVYLSHVADEAEYRCRQVLDATGHFQASLCVRGDYRVSIAVDGELHDLGSHPIATETHLNLALP